VWKLLVVRRDTLCALFDPVCFVHVVVVLVTVAIVQTVCLLTYLLAQCVDAYCTCFAHQLSVFYSVVHFRVCRLS